MVWLILGIGILIAFLGTYAINLDGIPGGMLFVALMLFWIGLILLYKL